MDSVTQLFANFPLDLCMLGLLLSPMPTSVTGQPTVSSREATDVSPWRDPQDRSTSQRVSSQPRYLARPEPVETRHDSAQLAGMSYGGTVRQLDAAMLEAVERSDSGRLKKLFDAHPHAAPEPADSSAGAAIRRFFRKIASWFNSDAWAWQGREAVPLLNAAASAGNAETIQILLDRGMDLGRDKAMILPALKLAVAGGHAEAARMLLPEVLRDDPRYLKDAELTRLAARKGYAAVLEVLVGQGMALPPERCWPHYAVPVRDYLCWTAASRQPAGTVIALSSVARSDLGLTLSRLDSRFNAQLNGMERRPMNAAQRACRQAGVHVVSRLAKVDPQNYKDAGFTPDTADTLANALNANADHFRDREGKLATAVLDKAVTDEFGRFTASGTIRRDLHRYLIKNGMYNLLASLVVAASELAVESRLWDRDAALRELLFVKALLQCVENQSDDLNQAARESGNPVLFNELLAIQMKSFGIDWEGQCAETSAAIESAQAAGAPRSLP